MLAKIIQKKKKTWLERSSIRSSCAAVTEPSPMTAKASQSIREVPHLGLAALDKCPLNCLPICFGWTLARVGGKVVFTFGKKKKKLALVQLLERGKKR